MNLICNRISLIICLMPVGLLKSIGQNEFLSTVNYNNLTITRLANISGVTWVTEDNPAYDANHQRFFFQGNTSNVPPWYLFTIDAVSGAVLSNPEILPGNPRAQLFGLQYDNNVDTLYGLYLDGSGGFYLSWIEPGTGIIHPKQNLSSFSGYLGSTFDTRDHFYIWYNAQGLMTLDAQSGNIVYQPSFPSGVSAFNLIYDNATADLYGIASSGSQSSSFVSVSLNSAATQTISVLPVSGFPQINAYTIDESNGKYIFVGNTPGASTCINKTLFVLDISSGRVMNNILYPYAEDPTNPLDSNLIEYNFDNKRGLLYALCWHPTLATIRPQITIAASSDPICTNSPANFSATLATAFIENHYQWQSNGDNVGGDSPNYTSTDPQEGETIRCIFAGSTTCGGLIDTSNAVVLHLIDTGAAAVQITASAGYVCQGSMISFSASGVNDGPSPFYQWQVNGVNVGSDSAGFTTGNWFNGDKIACLMTSNATCISNTPALSNFLSPAVVPVSSSSITITATSTDICFGDTVIFSAIPTNGGNSPSYQWQINGSDIGADNGLFASSSLANGDDIQCIMSSSVTCSQPVVSVNTITLTVRPLPVVRMQSDTSIARGQHIQLTPYYAGNITGYQWEPANSLDNASLPDPIASPFATTTYSLNVTDEDGCAASVKTTIHVFTPLAMPGAFSPNGDGKNDVFRIPPSLNIKLLGFSIYNRWGQRMFFTANSEEGWNGMINGSPQPVGAYVWEIEYEDPFTNKVTSANGCVILVR